MAEGLEDPGGCGCSLSKSEPSLYQAEWLFPHVSAGHRTRTRLIPLMSSVPNRGQRVSPGTVQNGTEGQRMAVSSAIVPPGIGHLRWGGGAENMLKLLSLKYGAKM